MYILVLNSGSSSVKYQLFAIDSEQVVTKGLVEKIGGKEAIYTYETAKHGKLKEVHSIQNHEEALSMIFKGLTSPANEIISDIKQIAAVGHRVLHGGAKFTSTALVNDEVIKAIRECIELGPLHNPHNLKGIDVCLRLLPGTPQVAVFDTAFHQTMPEKAYLYALPYVFYTKHKVRRYGFHGTSHCYVTERAASMLGKAVKNVNMISCHLGNGSSVCAIRDGKSVDTSMGFTPLEGLIMGTRSGDIDPAIIQYIMHKENYTVQEVDSLLNKQSGLLGISGATNDLRELFALADKKDQRAQLAIDMMLYRLKKYISSYMGALGGACDAIVFTAGIGENNPYVREQALEGLEFMGICIDKKKNKAVSGEAVISTDDSRVKVLVIPTNEELLIARDAATFVRKKRA